jgi:hypothetical protein
MSDQGETRSWGEQLRALGIEGFTGESEPEAPAAAASPEPEAAAEPVAEPTSEAPEAEAAAPPAGENGWPG